MAKTQGYCTHCGSLINLDDSQEKVKCIFCQGEVEVDRALALNEDSEARLLLQDAAYRKSVEEDRVKKQAEEEIRRTQPLAKKTAKTSADAQKSAAPELQPMPLKSKLILLFSILGIIALIAAAFVPTTINRNHKRHELDTAVDASGVKVEFTSRSFKFFDNSEYILATNETLSEEDAMLLYESYINKYTELYSTDRKKVEEKIKFSVYDADGIYESDSSGKGSLEFREIKYVEIERPDPESNNSEDQSKED